MGGMMCSLSYGRLTREGAGWVLYDAPPHVAIKLKGVFGHIAKASRGPFTFGADAETCADLEWFRSRYPFQMSVAEEAALIAGRREMEAGRAEAGRILAPGWAPPPVSGLQPGEALRPIQAQAVEILQRYDGLLIADSVGAGKTFTSCGAFLREGNLPAIVVAPPHLATQWCKVIHRFTTLKAVQITRTQAADLPPADVYVFRYTNIHGWIDVLEALSKTDAGLGLVVFDEVSELRHGAGADHGHLGDGTRKGEACLTLARMARRVAGLDATPLYNWGVEIWTIMDYLRPGLLGTRGEFVREWCNEYGRLTDPVALGTYLQDRFALVRRMGKGVPVKTSIVPVEHDPGPIDAIAAKLDALAITAASGSYYERGEAVREMDLRLRQATGLAKARYVARLAEMILEGGRKVLMAGWHRGVYEIWNEELARFNPVMFTGSETAAQKQRALDAFINGDSHVCFMSLRSGKGVDGLQAACATAIIGEYDWSPSTQHQFVGRLAREGQLEAFVDAIYPTASDGSDPPMIEKLGLKASEHASILDLDASVVADRELDTGSRMAELARAWRERRAS